MLNRIVVCIAAMCINNAYANTPSEYSKDNAVISIKGSGDAVAFSINSSVDMHACEISELATIIDDSRALYTSSDPEEKCTVLLTIGEDTLKVTTKSCDSYCGQNAIGSMDGLYRSSIAKYAPAARIYGASPSSDLPMADINDESAEIIEQNWNAREPAFQSEIALLGQTDPDRGVALVKYLNVAFSESGYSLDKTFNTWSQKVLGPPPGAAMYPELYHFGVRFGFVAILAHLTEMGPTGFNKIQSSGVFSGSTIKLYENFNLKRKK